MLFLLRSRLSIELNFWTNDLSRSWFEIWKSLVFKQIVFSNNCFLNLLRRWRRRKLERNTFLSLTNIRTWTNGVNFGIFNLITFFNFNSFHQIFILFSKILLFQTFLLFLIKSPSILKFFLTKCIWFFLNLFFFLHKFDFRFFLSSSSVVGWLFCRWSHFDFCFRILSHYSNYIRFGQILTFGWFLHTFVKGICHMLTKLLPNFRLSSTR